MIVVPLWHGDQLDDVQQTDCRSPFTSKPVRRTDQVQTRPVTVTDRVPLYRLRLALVLLQERLCSTEKNSTTQSRHLSSSFSLHYCQWWNTYETFLCSVAIPVTLYHYTRFQWYCWDTYLESFDLMNHIIFCPYILTLCLIDHQPRCSRLFLYNVFCALTVFCNLLQDWVHVSSSNRPLFFVFFKRFCKGVSFSPLLISYLFCFSLSRELRGLHE